MAVSPVNLARISQNLRLNLTVDAITRGQRALYMNEVRIAAGRSFVTPSEDPVAAARARELRNQLARQGQLTANLQAGSDLLTAADGALTDVGDLLIRAQAVASQNISNLTSEAERESEAEIIASILHELVNVGNRQFGDRRLFAGRDSQIAPFVEGGGGILYQGDTEPLRIHVGDGRMEVASIPGQELYGAASASVAGDADLTPTLLPDTRLEDLDGALGKGIRKGVLTFNDVGGAGVFNVDLTPADTIGDVVDFINAAAQSAGASLTVSLTETGLRLDPGSGEVLIDDSGSADLAADLGLTIRERIEDVLDGTTLRPRLTPLTPVSALALGEALDLESGLILRNGPNTATIDLSTAETVEDVLAAINGAGVFVEARISEDGRSIDLFSRVSGVDLRITENGGTTATDLGLRTMSESTLLSELNYGRGVEMNTDPDGSDLVIKDETGATLFEVQLAGALTLGDVVDRINEAAEEASASVRAELSADDNAIRLFDGGSVGRSLAVENAVGSYAAEDLGLTRATSGPLGGVIGRDVHPVTAPGVLDALIRLEGALRGDDDQELSIAAERVETIVDELIREHGILGARAAALNAEVSQMKDASISTEVFLSQVEDLDFTKAISELQSAQTVLQASLMTNSRLLNVSLMDYL
ncbi:MAG: hypothetical protein FLDDKLPJ_01422 [Phycisphaerae bacterium]|nr:hypothetical protein [Phycisphaerae bacterium]